MASPLQYKVYKRKKGNSHKKMLASFASRWDAVNYACQQSAEQYAGVDNVIQVYDAWAGRIYQNWTDGKASYPPKRKAA